MSNSSPIKYAELVDAAKLQALMESFNQAIGIANAVIDVEGVVIASAGWQDVCTKFHRVNPETCRRCIESDTSLVESMTRGAQFAVYGCLNGLTDTAAPIIVDGHHVANVFTGQFFTAPPDLDFFRKQARQFGFNENSYLDAVCRVPVLPRERVETVTRLYAQLAQVLADGGLDRLRQIEASRALAEANERILHDREAQFRHAIETSVDGYWMTDVHGRFLEVNDAYVKASGYSREELLSMGIPDIEVVESPADTALHISKVINDGFDSFESQHRTKDGRIWFVDVTASYSPVAGGRLFAFVRDISSRKKIEQELMLTQFVMDNAYVEVYWLDRNARIHYVNRQACDTLGYTFGELTQLTIPDIDPLFPVEKWDEHWQALRTEKTQFFETQHKRKDGSTFPVEVVANYVKFGEVEYNVAFTRDISERREFERKLTEQAHTDYLTGLANRRYFSEQVELEINRSARYGSPLSVLLLDIDHFKSINDTYGHKMGDLVLVTLAEVCRKTLREVDVIGRWGGEEFAFLLPETSPAMAAEVAERLRTALSAELVAGEDGRQLSFTVSIGCASRLGPQDNFDSLFIQADRALYEAKRAGRNRMCQASSG